jgi:hypothetical protein
MARKIDHHHPELPTTRVRGTRPAAPHDPRNRMIFSPSGAFLGFAAPPASTHEAVQIDTEKESQ